MTQELITALFDRWAGKPILVIGGGPSVAVDLPKIDFEPACVISANDHGDYQTRFKLDLIVNCDKRHCFLHCNMSDLLRPLAAKHGAAIVNAHSWADYRLGDMSYRANTGMTAVFVAAALGGHPVVPLGIDFFKGGHVYFHTPRGGKNIRPDWHISRVARKGLEELLKSCTGAHIRPLSGPLLKYFPAYDPAEVLPPRTDMAYRKHMRKNKTTYFHVQRPFNFGTWDRVQGGVQLALTPKEAQDPRMRAGL